METKVPEEMAGERLDRVLAALGLCGSRRAARQALERGAVFADGRRVRVASRPIGAGTRLRVEGAPAAPAADVPVRLLWEGPGLVALDKPGGVPIAPTREAVAGCLLDALARQRHLALSRLHPVHRLDTPTSGVVLVALEGAEAARLGEAFASGAVRKTYLAWVLGSPEPAQGLWSWPLSPPRGGVVSVDPAGKPAVTRYSVERTLGGLSFLRLEPETGRTHQLRVHCAAAGCPILGDRKYGRGAMGTQRALLHAARLSFPLPGGGEVTVEAPLPPEMVAPPLP